MGDRGMILKRNRPNGHRFYCIKKYTIGIKGIFVNDYYLRIDYSEPITICNNDKVTISHNLCMETMKGTADIEFISANSK